jgi:NADH:ubiquinone oxidoreductase subunit D
MKTVLLVVLLVSAGAFLLAADIESVKSEPNLERRSEKALLNAEAAFDAARKAHSDGADQAFTVALAEIGQSIQLIRQSLDDSGKNARKSPKYFKKAEVGLRKLGRRLDSFRVELSVDERAPVEKLVQQAHETQEHLLHAIMGKK